MSTPSSSKKSVKFSNRPKFDFFGLVASSIRSSTGLLGTWHTQIDAPNRPALPEYPYTYDLTKQLISVASQHNDPGYGAFWAGMNVGQIRELEAADLINQLVLEIKTH